MYELRYYYFLSKEVYKSALGTRINELVTFTLKKHFLQFTLESKDKSRIIFFFL